MTPEPVKDHWPEIIPGLTAEDMREIEGHSNFPKLKAAFNEYINASVAAALVRLAQ